MKTIGKSLDGNVIIELENNELEIITSSLNSYSLKMDNLGFKNYVKEVDNIFFQLLRLKLSKQ